MRDFPLYYLVVTFKRVVFIAILIILSTLVSSCKNSTSDETGSITGKVVLVNDTGNPAINPEDMSGIIVALYLPASLDSTACRIRNEHGDIGIELNQENSFNHLQEIPLQEVIAGPDGNFSINNVKPGVYNLVARKNGWGEVYRFGVEIAKNGQYQPTSLATEDLSYNATRAGNDITLYPIVDLYSANPQDFVFKEDHVYQAEQDAIFLKSVTLEGGSIVRIGTGCNVSFVADLICDPNSRYTLFTNTTNDLNSKWNSIKVFSPNQHLTKLVFRNGDAGLELHGNQSSIKNSFFDNLSTGIYAEGERIEASNLIFRDVSDRAFSINQGPNSNDIKYDLHNNIFLRVTIGLRTQGRAVSIMHNYFAECTNGVISFTGFHKIERNSFDRNINGIVCNGTSIDIKDNNFFANGNSIIFTRAYYSAPSNPKIYRNNFFQTSGYVVKLDGITTNTNIDAKNNYWLSPDIDLLVYDVHDLPILANEILYLPKSASIFVDAGV
ncbi:MAG: hypothetical protein PHY48_02665 [Candidatus Cloacimonetes bacterium]|nr:hypothetical protein [Candidatus Cloacimonadota bacterium]